MIRTIICVVIICSNCLFYGHAAGTINTATIKGVNRTGQHLFIELDRWQKDFNGRNDIQLAIENDIDDSTFTLTISNLKKPLFCFLKGLNIGNYNLYVNPGDNVSLFIEKSTADPYGVWFYGKNSENYNYDILLSRLVSKYYQNKSKNWAGYKANADALYAAQLAFIRKYSKQKSPPAELIKTMKFEALGSYYSWISNAYVQKTMFVDTMLPRRLLDLNTVPFYLFNDTALLRSRVYTLGLGNLLDIINGCPGFNRSPANILLSFNNINKYFVGRTREFLLADMVNSYGHYAQLAVDSSTYHQIWDRSYNSTIDAFYKQWMVQSKEYFFKANKPFPTATLEVLLRDDEGTSLTLGELLKKYTGKPILLDFWATWCGPCKQEFLDGDGVVEKLKSRGYKFIYISIDKDADFAKMRSDAQSYHLDGNDFQLQESSKKLLSGFLNINTIPRMILIDSKGVIKNLDMPKPSNEIIFKNILARLQ